MALHISIAAETIAHIGPLPITNSLLSTWVVMAILFLLSVAVTSHLQKKPGRIQVAAELIVSGLYSFFTNLGGKHGKTFTPLAVTIFLFVLLSNWFGLLPGVGTIGFYESGKEEVGKLIQTVRAAVAVQEPTTNETTTVNQPKTDQNVNENTATQPQERVFVPLLRGPTADLNTTLALAIIVVFLIQYYGFKFGGVSYAKKFIDFRSPIYFFVGILELVSDISKVLSFSFRLFGNVFAGEVLLAVMAFLFAFFLPIPFYGLELFVGAIQALVFGMLTVVFLSIAVSHGDHEHTDAAESH